MTKQIPFDEADLKALHDVDLNDEGVVVHKKGFWEAMSEKHGYIPYSERYVYQDEIWEADWE